MRKMSNWFYNVSSGWVALIALIVFVLFSVLTLPGQNALTQQYSNGTGSPDTSLFYSSNKLYSMAEEYGEDGRAAYLHTRWTFDLAFPLIYTALLIITVSWGLNKISPAGSKWRFLNLIPSAAMALDFLENSAASLVMSRFPAHNIIGENLAPIFTPLKWTFVGASFLILILSLIIMAGKWILKRV